MVVSGVWLRFGSDACEFRGLPQCCIFSMQLNCLHLLQSHAAQGRDPESTPLHVCQCPSCFTAFAKSNGEIECVPKCDLADCDEDTGVCSEAGGKGT